MKIEEAPRILILTSHRGMGLGRGEVADGEDDGYGAGVGGAGQQDPEGLLGAALAAQEVHVDLGVGVAAEHRGEHQDEDEHDHRPDGPRPQVLDTLSSGSPKRLGCLISYTWRGL